MNQICRCVRKNYYMTLKYNTKLIKARNSYTVAEIANLFDTHKRTCFRWLEEGLKVVRENTNPLLIMGYDLKKFLQARQKARKTKLQANEYYCCKCHRAVKAKIGSEKVIKTGKTLGKQNIEQLNKIGICNQCGSKINRFLGVCH